MEGRNVMKQGLIRRIGTGENTQPWRDNWIPRDFMLQPMACLKAAPPKSVASFINVDATWKLDNLKEFFLPMDVEAICSIPLCTKRMDDIWSWHYERIGILLVR